MNSPLITQAEFAAYRGVGKPAVSNWKRQGLLVFGEDPARPGKALVNVSATDARLSTRVDPTRGRPRGGAAQPIEPSAAAAPADMLPLAGSADRKVAEVRLELLEEQRDGQRMKNLQSAGDLVPRIAAEQRLAEAVRMIFSRLTSTHRGLAERLASATEPRAVVAILEEATDRVRTDLANRIEGGLDADDDADDLEGGDLSTEAEASQ
jgi:phage terminase Nu1 subunit (DNA packaging protein)